MDFNMTLQQWLERHHTATVFNKVSWMGVPMFKNVLDAWIYQELIYRVRPDVIVEIGSAAGGSTLYFAHLLECIGKGMVVSVDVDRSRYKAKHGRIMEITGDSTNAAVIEAVATLCKNKTTLINQDGNHHHDHVLADLNNYSGLVTMGSYFIVEDSLIDLCGEPLRAGIPAGPLTAIRDFLKGNDKFVSDIECERYILTANPFGYLKRVA